MQLRISTRPACLLRLRALPVFVCVMLAGVCSSLQARPVATPSVESLRDSSTHAALFKVIKVAPSSVVQAGSPSGTLEGYVAHTATCELISPVKGELPKEFAVRFFVYDKPMFNGSVCAYLELFVGSRFIGFLKADPDAPGEYMGCNGHLDEGMAIRPLDVPLHSSWMEEVQKRKREKYAAPKRP